MPDPWLAQGTVIKIKIRKSVQGLLTKTLTIKGTSPTHAITQDRKTPTFWGRDFRHNESKEEVRWDPGKEGEHGWEGKNHWHRHNPNKTGKKDYYLDKNGNPVSKGSAPSHIKAPSLNFFQKSWKNLKEWYKKGLREKKRRK